MVTRCAILLGSWWLAVPVLTQESVPAQESVQPHQSVQAQESGGDRPSTLKPAKYDFEYRVWYETSGIFSVVAKFHSFDNGRVRLQAAVDREPIVVELDALSASDRSVLEAIRHELQRRSEVTPESLAEGLAKIRTAASDYFAEPSATAAGNATDQTGAKAEEIERQLTRSITGEAFEWYVRVKDVDYDRFGTMWIDVDPVFTGAVEVEFQEGRFESPRSAEGARRFFRGQVVRLTGVIQPARDRSDAEKPGDETEKPDDETETLGQARRLPNLVLHQRIGHTHLASLRNSRGAQV